MAVRGNLLLALCLLLGLWRAISAETPVPPLQARVTDLTGTLRPADREALEQRLAAIEARKGSQIVVLIIPSTQPETIEQYGIRVADRWKIGRGGVDDGVLILVASNDRTVRIEVGRGLEGAIPDAIAKRIIAEDVVPQFRRGDFYGGLSAAVERLAAIIDGEALPAPEASPDAAGSHGADAPISLIATIALGIALHGALGAIGAGLLAGTVAAVIFGTLLGLAALEAAFVGFFVFVVVVSAVSRNRGGFYTGSGYGGGFSRGGFNGRSGGFSGGGGGFSGGGASGSW
ncbi:MAG: YgcG family protein [Methylotetracoccus sp.]